jgi:hypothetical protein
MRLHNSNNGTKSAKTAEGLVGGISAMRVLLRYVRYE